MMPVLMPTYGRADLAFERGSGAYLYTADGRRFLDFASGIAVTGLGHAHPHLVKALTEQAQKLWHASNIFRIPGRSSWPSVWWMPPSPTACSSPIPAPRRSNAG